MANSYPEISWPVFDACNANQTKAFENMTRKLFSVCFAGDQQLVSDGINPGIEVLPVLEQETKDEDHRKRISFQSKYFGKSNKYSEIEDSAKQIVKHYSGELDLVYLFCNNKLKVTCNSYKNIERILSNAGIELCPITDEAILDLVLKYPDIYNYYFRKRDLPDLSSGSQPRFTIDQISSILTKASEYDERQSLDPALLADLIKDRISVCRRFVLGMELDQLKTELEKLLSYNLSGVEGSDTLLFYKNLLNLHEGHSIEHMNSNEKYKTEIEWLRTYYRNPYDISIEEFIGHLDEVQVFLLNKLFIQKRWNAILALHDQKIASESIYEQMELYYGLSLFNLQRFGEASSVLHCLYEKTGCAAHEMYCTFADIQIINESFRTNMKGDTSMLAELVSSLDRFREIKQYHTSELLIALLTMESYYFLGMSEKDYLEKAIAAFATFSDSVRLHSTVRFYYALCVEYNGDLQEAIDLYELMEWKIDENIAFRYLSCLIIIGQYDKAIQQYDIIEETVNSERLYSIFLFALYRVDAQKGRDLADEWLKSHSDDFFGFISFIIYMEDEETIKSLIIPKLNDFMTEENLSNLSFRQRIELILWLARNGEIELMGKILSTIKDVAQLNDIAVMGIYRSLSRACHRPGVFSDRIIETTETAQVIESIADSFLQAGIKKELFLKIKISCVNAKESNISLLKYSKELFELTHDETTARNIIGLLVSRKEDSASEYQPYLDALRNSEEPNQCVAVAAGLLMLGREQEADSYAYRAIYYLNGKDDYNIYNQYFQIANYKMRWLHETEEEPIRSSRGNVVVALKPVSGSAELTEWNVCLDSENELSQDDNKSMGIDHLHAGDMDYLKIKSAGLNQIVNLKKGTFQVKRIVSRKKFCRSFVFGKIQENQGEFYGTLISVPHENPKEMIEQLRKICDRSEQASENLKMYHFEEGNFGLPIEVVGFMDYDRYLGTFMYLLYDPDEVLYSGEVVLMMDGVEEPKYVPTLSTLALLSIMDRLDVLDVIKQTIILPRSYLAFFREMLEKELDARAFDAKTLCFDGDKPVLSDHNPKYSEIWERILNFCEGCGISDITDQERIDFSFPEGFKGEALIAAFKLNVIQLDALVLAKKESAWYLSDDLYFRKIANWASIKHCNTASVLQLHNNQEYRDAFVLELAKTNYVYVPLVGISYTTFQAIQEDLLKGKRKKELNAGWIQQYYSARETVLRKLFGDEIYNMLMEDNRDLIETEENSITNTIDNENE